MAAEKWHPAPYYVSRALANYIKGEGNPWKDIGLSPNEPGAIADQLITNGRHYAFSASDMTAQLLHSDGLVVSPQLEKNREEYRDCFGDLYKVDPKASVGPKVEGRDTRGRIKWTGKTPISKSFFDKWIFPPSDESIEETIIKRIEAREKAEFGDSESRAFPVQFYDELERRLEELRFYRRLRNGEQCSVHNEYENLSLERYLLDCYKRLLPIWIYVQCLPVEEGSVDHPLNLYNLDFWSWETEGKAPVLKLVDDLCECFDRDSLAYGRESIEDFRKLAKELFENCTWDEGELKKDRKRYSPGSVSSVEELFEESLCGEFDLPQWATDRAKIIGLIIVGSFVGVQAGLDFADEWRDPNTLDEIQQEEEILDSDELRVGSGEVPLLVRLPGERPDVQVLDLRGPLSVPRPLFVFGGREAGELWGSQWGPKAREYVRGSLFSPAAYLDPDSPQSLFCRLCGRLEHFNWGRSGFSELEEVRSGLAADRMRDEIEHALSACLDVSLGTETHPVDDPRIDVGVRDCPEGGDTLAGAMKAAADGLDAWLVRAWKRDHEKKFIERRACIEESDLDPAERAERQKKIDRQRGSTRVPSVKGDLFKSLKYVTADFYSEQCDLSAGNEDASLIGAALSALERHFVEKVPHDPSMYCFVQCLKKRLRELLWKGDAETGSPRSKSIKLSAVMKVVNAAIEAAAQAEIAGFITLGAPDVSGRHAMLYLDENGTLRLADVGSLHGTAVIRECTGETFVLKGVSRTRIEDIKGAKWMTREPALMDTVAVRRGDVIRLAGKARIEVGG